MASSPRPASGAECRRGPRRHFTDTPLASERDPPPLFAARQLDVFASVPFSGNPLACVIDGDGLTTKQMHTFTKWANLSESSFLLEPTVAEADYRVRIFTPGQELPFAGHPTIGSCQAWLNAGGQPATPGRIVQECGVGLVELKQADDQIAFAAPPLIRGGEVGEALIVEMAQLLGIDRSEVVGAQWGDNGPGWVVLMLESAAAVLALDVPDPSQDLDLGVVGLYPEGSNTGCAIELRAFFSHGMGAVSEDPVTGSLNASTAQWLLGTGELTAPYVASQGTAMGRRGRIYVDQDVDEAIWVGGVAVASITGEIDL